MSRIDSFTLPLFLIRPYLLPHVSKQFGFFGRRVVPGPVAYAAKLSGLEMGAVVGRARPDLIESVVKSHSDSAGDDARVSEQRRLLRVAADELANRLTSDATFDQLYPESPNEGAVDADAAIGLAALEFLIGLEFGAARPDLTRTAIENQLTDKRGIRRALKAAGLSDGSSGYTSYAERESDVLTLVDVWQTRVSSATT